MTSTLFLLLEQILCKYSEEQLQRVYCVQGMDGK